MVSGMYDGGSKVSGFCAAAKANWVSVAVMLIMNRTTRRARKRDASKKQQVSLSNSNLSKSTF